MFLTKEQMTFVSAFTVIGGLVGASAGWLLGDTFTGTIWGLGFGAFAGVVGVALVP